VSERKHNQLLARAAVTVSSALRRVWVPDGGQTASSEIGLVLTEVFYTANPWVTVGYVTERLGGIYSDDTTRRRLEELVDTEKVEVVEAGGRKLYRACPAAAKAVMQVLEDGLNLASVGKPK
jgi:hypothetical protein